MGIYIRGMEMPTECRGCPFEMYYWNVGETRCRATNRTLANDYKPIPFEGKDSACPLVELPQHGDLIDRDAAYEQFLNLMDVQGAINPCQLGTILVDAPTIIEAEPPKEET